jgi:hypothetical protein
MFDVTENEWGLYSRSYPANSAMTAATSRR